MTTEQFLGQMDVLDKVILHQQWRERGLRINQQAQRIRILRERNRELSTKLAQGVFYFGMMDQGKPVSTFEDGTTKWVKISPTGTWIVPVDPTQPEHFGANQFTLDFAFRAVEEGNWFIGDGAR